MKKESQLLTIDAPELSVIEKSKAEQIKATFEPMAKMLSDFEESYNNLISESQSGITKEITAKAKRLRLDIGKVRIDTEKIRKEQKEEYLRAGKAIDGVSNILKWAVSDKETKLKEIEDYFEIQEQKRLDELQSKRVEELSKYVDDAHERSLSSMDEDVWEAYLSTKKQEHEDRLEAERIAEEERKERERIDVLKWKRSDEIRPYYNFFKDDGSIQLGELSEEDYQALLLELKKAKKDHDEEQEKIQKENERLKKEREAAEAKRVEEEKKRKEDEAKKEAEHQAQLQKEREEKERLIEENRKREESEKAAKQAELNKGDAEKVKDLKDELRNITVKYTFKSDKNKKMYSDVCVLLEKVINHIK